MSEQQIDTGLQTLAVEMMDDGMLAFRTVGQEDGKCSDPCCEIQWKVSQRSGITLEKFAVNQSN